MLWEVRTAVVEELQGQMKETRMLTSLVPLGEVPARLLSQLESLAGHKLFLSWQGERRQVWLKASLTPMERTLPSCAQCGESESHSG